MPCASGGGAGAVHGARHPRASRRHDDAGQLGPGGGLHPSARAKRSAASSAEDFSVWSDAIRLSSQVFGIVTMLSVFATQRFGNPSRLPSGTSVGIPRVVVEISTTAMDARTA